MNIINYLVPVASAAFNPSTPGSSSITDVQGIIDLVKKIGGYISAVFYILAAVYLILAAFAYLQSGGEPAKIATAKNRVIYAAVAIAVAVLSTSMGTIIGSIL